MRYLVNDRWEAAFTVDEPGLYFYTVHGRVDAFRTWREDLRRRREAGQDIRVDLRIGAGLLEAMAGRAEAGPASSGGMDADRLRALAAALREESDPEAAFVLSQGEGILQLADRYPDRQLDTLYGRELAVHVERPRAQFGAWYELFPRSCGADGRPGTLADVERLLPEIARMGFDVLYLPPIHPIGRTHRKGRNNAPVAGPGDPGSPWAIGSEEGGHKSIDPALGALEDLRRLVTRAAKLGLEVALDLAFQCSPDHPYVREHPEWFRWRPDGSIQFAENPPKKYEDIVPFDFETPAWRALWEELAGVALYWVEEAGVRIFRVDNPHTKPFRFWEWLIAEVRRRHPEVIFLAEAFTRPKVMYRLAKLGFSQSYTYFTWRNTRRELEEYMAELSHPPVADFFRPSFWPNTPDILPEYLQAGGRAAFIVRLVLAATLSPSYGIYGPAYELAVAEALPGREEYLNAEKYEIRSWDRSARGSLRDLVTRLNRVRRENPALQSFRNVVFHPTDNDFILFYERATADLADVLFVAVNLDPFHVQSGRAAVDLERLGIRPDEPYLVHDLLNEDRFLWQGPSAPLSLDPLALPVQVLRVHRHLHREQDFDYFMRGEG